MAKDSSTNQNTTDSLLGSINAFGNGMATSAYGNAFGKMNKNDQTALTYSALNGQADNLKYPTATYDTGLYGKSTTNSNGTTWTPTEFQSNLVNYAQNNIPALLQQYINPTADSDWYKANQAVRQTQQNQAFENQVVNPLASRNLTRGSSVNALSNMFASNLAQQEKQALVDESTRAGELANTLLGYYQTPYSMMSDANAASAAQSNALANYELNRYNSINDNNLAYTRMLYNMMNPSTAISSNGGNKVGSGITGALGGAAAGATLGSALPGIGNAIGAGVGALLGGGSGLLSGGGSIGTFA